MSEWAGDGGDACVHVVGVVGADPDGLAAALGGTSSGWGTVRDRGTARERDAAGRCVVVALDLSCEPGAEERDLLADLADRGVSTALVATRVDRYPDWPDLVARARVILDPDRRLALFAVSVETGGGLDDVRRWFAGVEPGESTPVRPPTEVVTLGTTRCAGGAMRRPPVGPSRADRLTGVRAGVSAARADVVTAARESIQGLAVTADRECARVRRRDVDEYTQWLSDAMAAVDVAADALLAERLDRVRAVAALGSPEIGGPRPSSPHVRARTSGAVAPPPERRPNAEDAVMLLFGVTAGFGAGRVLVSPMAQWAGLGWTGTALTALTGLAVAAWIVGVRRTASTRTALRRWTADTVTLRRTALEHRLAAQLSDVEAAVGREAWNRTPARNV
ncbi:hypothetical protein L5G32_03070 [Gordonia sp. HY002]|uniref:hypothetical protein n=1 Tax=Gordonia zhenghanii TaxID=2911516 RepID=UPI001EF05352|nr:hypothetical protein [Gordonia zhenghanii]MCF8569249.1 hypothetical protein [Gordonia zhenghanii]MCF8605361.1 hypothetical protein [Gordonia zhenghanii]